jgi:hypothetical protein
MKFSINIPHDIPTDNNEWEKAYTENGCLGSGYKENMNGRKKQRDLGMEYHKEGRLSAPSSKTLETFPTTTQWHKPEEESWKMYMNHCENLNPYTILFLLYTDVQFGLTPLREEPWWGWWGGEESIYS